MKIKIWREKRQGKIHGRPVKWEEDHYRVTHFQTDKDDRPIPGPDGEPLEYVVVEALVDEGFKKMHPEVYAAHIQEYGKVKDERYRN